MKQRPLYDDGDDKLMNFAIACTLLAVAFSVIAMWVIILKHEL